MAEGGLTSRTLWQRTFGGAEFRSERLLSVGEVVIVPHSQLHGVDVRTGVTRWTFAGQGQTAGLLTPTLSGDTVFVAGFVGGTAAALDAKTGAVLWRREFAQTVFSPSVGTELVIYPLRSDSLPNELVALDRVTGEIRWRSTLPDSVGWPSGANAGGAIIGDRTIVATLLGRVSAFRLTDGELLWTRNSGNPSRAWYTSQPMVLGDVAIIMRTGDGDLQAWSRDGELEWTAPLGDGRATLQFSPRPCGVTICFARGQVSIIDPQGRILWMDGGGSGAIFLSNVTASDDGIMYAGVYFNASRRGRIRAFRPPVQVGATR